MSTAAVSNGLITQTQAYFQNRSADLQQLGKALENGNLAGAQTAYNNIVKLGQSGPSASGNPFLISQREQDFTAIGTALQAGDLAGAQQAYATLRGTAEKQAQGGAQNPPSASPTASVGPEIVLNLTNTGTTANPEQITININQTSGGGEQVALSVGNQGSTPQQITFNLPANSNEEIVLNLLNASASTSGAAGSTTSGSSASGGLSVTA
jgi:hypothetical protein